MPQAVPWIAAESICPFPRSPHLLPPEHGEGAVCAASLQGVKKGRWRYPEREV